MLLILHIILCAPSFLRVLQHLLVFYYFLNSTSRLDNFFPNHLSIDKIMYCEAAVCCCICLSALSIVGEGNTQRSKINFKYFTGFLCSRSSFVQSKFFCVGIYFVLCPFDVIFCLFLRQLMFLCKKKMLQGGR